MKRRVLPKTALFHTLLKKKKEARNGDVLNGTVGLLLPLDARSRGRRRFFFLCFPPPSPSKRRRLPFKKTPTKDPHLPKLFTCWRGGGGAAAQWPPRSLPPLFLPIKTGEWRAKKKGGTRRILAKIAKTNKNFILFVF